MSPPRPGGHTSATRSPAAPGRPADVTEVARVLDDVVDDLARLAGGAAPLWADGPPRAAGLAVLRPVIHDVLAARSHLVVGAGLAVGPGWLADEDRALEWWWTRGGRAAEALRVNLEPSAPDFYDFVAEEWFDEAVRTGRTAVAGPVVDYACTNDYALTIGYPVVHGDAIVAVAAADVPVERLEARLLPVLARHPRPLVVGNAAGRVVLSATATRWPGDRLDEETLGRGMPLGRGPLADWRLVPAEDRGGE